MFVLAVVQIAMQLQCAAAPPHPSGYLGLTLQGSTVISRPNQPNLYELGTVASVTPGSPAERGGVVRGDVLTSIAGVDAREAIALDTLVKPGVRVMVRVQRGNTTLQLTVVPEKWPEQEQPECETQGRTIARGFTFPTPPVSGDRPWFGLMMPGYSSMPAVSALAGAMLTTLDDDWRALAGTDTGVLVLTVAPGSPAREAGLRSGDVIVSADDQPVSSPRALTRIVSDVQSGTLKLQLVRAGKTIVIKARWGRP